MTGNVSKSCLYTYGIYRISSLNCSSLALILPSSACMYRDTQYQSAICMIYFHYCITPSKN